MLTLSARTKRCELNYMTLEPFTHSISCEHSIIHCTYHCRTIIELFAAASMTDLMHILHFSWSLLIFTYLTPLLDIALTCEYISHHPLFISPRYSTVCTISLVSLYSFVVMVFRDGQDSDELFASTNLTPHATLLSAEKINSHTLAISISQWRTMTKRIHR